ESAGVAEPDLGPPPGDLASEQAVPAALFELLLGQHGDVVRADLGDVDRGLDEDQSADQIRMPLGEMDRYAAAQAVGDDLAGQSADVSQQRSDGIGHGGQGVVEADRAITAAMAGKVGDQGGSTAQYGEPGPARGAVASQTMEIQH